MHLVEVGLPEGHIAHGGLEQQQVIIAAQAAKDKAIKEAEAVAAKRAEEDAAKHEEEEAARLLLEQKKADAKVRKAAEFEKKMGSTYNEFHVNKMQAKLIFIALNQERQHVLETQRESNEYANLLVAGRVLAEADEKERIDNLRGKAGTANGEAVKHGGMASLKFSLAGEPRLNMTSADVE